MAYTLNYTSTALGDIPVFDNILLLIVGTRWGLVDLLLLGGG
jgi:hypothetical protein